MTDPLLKGPAGASWLLKRSEILHWVAQLQDYYRLKVLFLEPWQLSRKHGKPGTANFFNSQAISVYTLRDLREYARAEFYLMTPFVMSHYNLHNEMIKTSLRNILDCAQCV